jgi:dephospho-CoA kinase
MPKLILGIAGEMGSGKGTIAKYISEKYEGNAHRFSTVLRDVLDRIYVEQTRENISAISTVLRKKFGEDILAKAMYHDTQNDKCDIVVIDGVRRMADIQYLQELPHFKFIYIDTDIKICYERIVKRGENTGDATKTFEEFKNDHELETELQIRDLKNYANYAISNNSNFEELYKQIDRIIAENLK